jgi:hypothetical protein
MASPLAANERKTIIAYTRSWQNCAKYSLEKYIFSPLVELMGQARMRAAPQLPTSPGKPAGRMKRVINLWKKPMNKLVAIAFASAAMISSAFAGEAEGVVSAVDAATATVALETGESFTVADGVSLDGVEAGKTVMIMFDDSTNVATEIAIVE